MDTEVVSPDWDREVSLAAPQWLSLLHPAPLALVALMTVWPHVDWDNPTASSGPPPLGTDEVVRRKMSSFLVEATGVTKSCS